MPTISPSRPTPLIQKSRLISSIAELEETVKETQASADLIETEIAYKDAEIDGLKRDRISHSGSTKRFDDAITQIRVKIQQLCDKFDEKIDTLAALRDRLEKKKAKLAAIAPVESTDAPDPKDDEEAAALLEITSTPWEQVFVTSDDGKTFVRPAMLRGVPSTPITEDGPYWVPTWTKFVDAMDADRLQRQYEDDVDERHERMLRGPLTDEEKEDFDKRDNTPSPRLRRTPTKKRVQTTAPEQGRRKRRKSTTIRQRTPEDEVIVVDDFTPPKKMRRLEFIIPLRPRSSVETLDFTDNSAVASSSMRAAVSTTAKTSSISEASERTSHRQGQTKTGLVRTSRPTDVEKHIEAAQDVIMEAMTEGEEMQNQWLHIGTSGSQHMSLDNLNSDGHSWDLAEEEHHTGNQESGMSNDSREDEYVSLSGVTEEEEGLLPRDEEVQFLAAHPRMDIGPSPFPRTVKKVSHGFIFPWLPCTEREAMVTYY
ncbi:hypothetical protein K4K59_002216 [Colletotrichum sp. SAR11_240]|nr:hypothetical protein K4K59_002216 [Colletotrichum sp. SAR11_240]